MPPSFPLVDAKTRPLVMGIVNTTPDSFSDGGRYQRSTAARDHARALIAAGADIIDIGGESTRPGASSVSPQEEIDRVLPLIESLHNETDILISIDTMKPEVAAAAVRAGAGLWNDVSALRFDEEAPAVAAKLGVPVILMHMQGTPGTMQDKPHYDDVVAEVATFLLDRIKAARRAGLATDKIYIDPGIGFGKRLADNLALMRHLPALIKTCDAPLVFGASRKRFIERLTPGADTDQRLGGSLAAAMIAAQAGAAIVRVHDVFETVQALTVWRAIEDAHAH